MLTGMTRTALLLVALLICGTWLHAAEKDARARKDDLLKSAREEAERLAEKARRDLVEEQRRLVSELRSDVAALALGAAEKLLQKSVDKSVQDKVLQEASAGLETWARERS